MKTLVVHSDCALVYAAAACAELEARGHDVQSGRLPYRGPVTTTNAQAFGADVVLLLGGGDDPDTSRLAALAARACAAPLVVLNPGASERVADWALVSNQFAAADAARDCGIPADRITTVGDITYDEWFENRATYNRDAACALGGINHTRAFVVCYASSIQNAYLDLGLLAAWKGAAGCEAGAPQIVVFVAEELRHLWAASGIATAVLRDDPADTVLRRSLLVHADALLAIDGSRVLDGVIANCATHVLTAQPCGAAVVPVSSWFGRRDDILPLDAPLGGHAGSVLPARCRHHLIEQYVRPGGATEPVARRIVLFLESLIAEPAGRRRRDGVTTRAARPLTFERSAATRAAGVAPAVASARLDPRDPGHREQRLLEKRAKVLARAQTTLARTVTALSRAAASR